MLRSITADSAPHGALGCSLAPTLSSAMATTCPLCGGVEEATRVTFTAILDGNLLFGPDRPRHAAAVACLLLC